MKRLMNYRSLAFLLAFCMTLSLLPGRARAAENVTPPLGIVDETETVYSSGYWGEESNNVAWATVNGGKKLYVFPVNPSKDGKLPNAFAHGNIGAPENYNTITEAVICEGISEVGECQFFQWNALEKLSLPESLVLIRHNAISGCIALRELNLGKCKTFPSNVLNTSVQLNTITIDADNTAFKWEGDTLLSKDGTWLYTFLSDAEEYTIPESVENLELFAFYTKTKLFKLHLPTRITHPLLGLAHFLHSDFQLYSSHHVYFPQDLSIFPFSDITKDSPLTFHIYYPGTPAEFQAYAGAASYVTERGEKDNFYFGEKNSPASKVFWKNEENGTTVKAVLAMPGDPITLPADSADFTVPTGGSFQDSFYFDGALLDKGAIVTMPDHDVTLYPNWYSSAVTVTLDVNGRGSLSETSLTLNAGDSYGTALPTGLTAKNYTFLGWYTAAEGGTEVTAETPIPSGDHTLYAHWAENPKYTVTLDLNDGGAGASVTPNSYEVYFPGTYPALATPSWAGHIFDGWFTEPAGGIRVEAGSVVNQDKAHPLYAHWTEIADVEVTLDAGEGTVTPQTVTASYPGQYPALAEASRPGYTFLGWFTAADGGSQVRAGDAVSQSAAHTLYAHWKKLPETYTLTLDPNGGILASDASLQITEGRPYPALPTPTKPGFDFTGWFSERAGGKQVTAGSALLTNGAHTLYAHYSQSAEHDENTVLNYSFRFANSSHDFQYPSGYRIPLKRFQEVYGSTARAQMLYEYLSEWTGSCAGMTIASALFYLPNPSQKPIRVQDFKQGPWQGTESALYETIGDMEIFGQHKTWQYSLRSLIEGLQLAQSTSNRDVFVENASTISSVFALVQRETSGPNPKPVYLGVSCSDGHHALLAYEAKVVSDTEARIYVYDCNYPKDGNRYVTLRKSDPDGHYDSYIYRSGYTYNASLTAASFRSDAYPAWLSSVDSKPPLDALRNLICVGAKKAKIVDANGNVVATVNGDGTTTTWGNVEELRMAAGMVDQNGNPVKTGIPETYAFLVPRGQYTIVNTDESAGGLAVSASNIDRSVKVETSANTMTVIVDDEQDVSYARIEDANADYKIVLGKSYEEENDNHFEEYLLTGSTGKAPVAFARKADATLTENLDLNQAGVRFETRVDAEVYHDVDLDAIAAECRNGEEYQNTFAQKAAEAVAEAKAADEAAPPMDSGWGTVTDEADKPRPITGSDLGAYKPMDSNHGGTATDEAPATPGHSGGGTPAAAAPEPTFTDVAKDAYYYEAVRWAAEQGIIHGVADGTFAPDRSCTRAEIATMLYRAAGKPAVAGASPFRDAAADTYYRDAVIWAYQSGVSKGTSESAFSPEQACTRAQIITMLYRAAGAPPVTGTAPFRDVRADAYYYDAVIWAYQNGIVKGTAADVLSPDTVCTRAMAAAMLHRAK